MPRLTRVRVAALTILAGVAAAGGPAVAGRQTYTYTVEHSRYGDIGTYTNIIQQAGETTTVESHLRVLVTVLGLPVHREEADRLERWRGGRLISFQSVTTANGDRIEVHGEANGDRFVIISPAGTIIAPADVMPTNPCSANFTGPRLMLMDTKTGKLEPVRVTSDGVDSMTVQGTAMTVRHYRVHGDKPKEIWVDERGVPVRFRIEEAGSPVDFILKP